MFAAGDIATGPDTVVWALAAGKRAAECVDRYLSGLALEPPVKPSMPSVRVDPPAASDAVAAGRAHQASLPSAKRSKNFSEVESGLTEQQAVAEARRCLRCDLEFEPSCGAEFAACSEGEKEA